MIILILPTANIRYTHNKFIRRIQLERSPFSNAHSGLSHRTHSKPLSRFLLVCFSPICFRLNELPRLTAGGWDSSQFTRQLMTPAACHVPLIPATVFHTRTLPCHCGAIALSRQILWIDKLSRSDLFALFSQPFGLVAMQTKTRRFLLLGIEYTEHLPAVNSGPLING